MQQVIVRHRLVVVNRREATGSCSHDRALFSIPSSQHQVHNRLYTIQDFWRRVKQAINRSLAGTGIRIVAGIALGLLLIFSSFSQSCWITVLGGE